MMPRWNSSVSSATNDGVAGSMQMELHQNTESTAVGHLPAPQAGLARAARSAADMQFAKEIVEMHPALFRQRQAGKEMIDNKGFCRARYAPRTYSPLCRRLA